MHKKPTSRDLQNEATRQLLLETANRLLSQNRYDLVSVKDICNACGVSVGTFYHHFKNKESLVEFYYMDFDRYIGQFSEKYASVPPVDALFLLIGHETDYLQTSVTFPTQIMIMQLVSGGTAFHQKSRTYVQNVNSIAKRIVAESGIEGLTPSDLREHILRCIRGVLYDWCLHNGKYNLKKRVTGDMRLILAGLGVT